jgi:hypothetical protein
MMKSAKKWLRQNATNGMYATFMKRIEELVAATDCAKAANDFSKEIPGALPLLWHFFNRLQSPDWLPHLARLNLLAAPLSEMEERGVDSLPLGQWPAGRYLQRMAASGDPKARRLVADALRAVSASTHPHVLQSGMDILAALLAGDAAPLVDLAEVWLNTGGRFMVMGEGPHRLIRNLAEGKRADAALRVMRALFKVFEEDSRLTTLFSRHMYEHFLPGAVKALAPVAGPRTVALLCDLLDQAVRISRRVTDDPPHDYTYYLSSEISEQGIKHDVTDALVGEIVDAAKLALVTDPTCMAALIATIRGHSPKIFIRIALHILSLNPAAAPDVAETLLTDRELIERSWCRKEYAELALAWFPSLPAAVQKQILDYVDQQRQRFGRGGLHRAGLTVPELADLRLEVRKHLVHVPRGDAPAFRELRGPARPPRADDLYGPGLRRRECQHGVRDRARDGRKRAGRRGDRPVAGLRKLHAIDPDGQPVGVVVTVAK